MKPNFPILDSAKMPEALKPISAPLIQSFKRLQEMTNGQLSIADNLNAAVIQVDCVHNTECLVPQNILRGRPAFFQPLYTTVSRTDPTPATPIANCNRLNLSRTDGYVGLTVRFDPRGPYAEFSSSGAQAIATGTQTVVSFQTTDVSDSFTVISVASNGSGPASSRITVAASGIYEVTGQAVFESNATGYRESYWFKNGAGSIPSTAGKGQASTPTVSGDIWSENYAAKFSLAASDYIELFMYQNSGGNLNARSGADKYGNRVQVQRVGFVSGSVTACVTGILWGG